MYDEVRGDWIRTFTGKKFYPLDPRPEDIDIEDIAHALSNLCRFAGHSKEFYSVAQHSCLVAMALPPELAIYGILHDASEAYIVDIPSPLKRYLPGYKEIENKIMGVIYEKFGLDPNVPPIVKEMDERILVNEMKALLPTMEDCNFKYPEGAFFHGLGAEIVWDPWYRDKVKEYFLQDYRLYMIPHMKAEDFL